MVPLKLLLVILGLVSVKKNTKPHEFKETSVDGEVDEVAQKKHANESEHEIKWAVNMYHEWRNQCINQLGVPIEIMCADLNCLYALTQQYLCYSLSCFIHEVKKVDRCEYPPNTLKEIIIMIKM